MNSSILIIAVNTFRELIRGKALYATLFFAALIVILSALFGSVSVGDQILVIKDFGLFSISLSSVLFAVITGASLLNKELEKKTIYNLLSKPVHRWEFVAGKFLGMYATQLIYLAITSLLLCSMLGFYTSHFDLKLLMACSMVSLELLIVSAATIFFASIVVTPFLNAMFSFAFFLAGRSVEYIRIFSEQNIAPDSALAAIAKLIYYALPQLPKVNLADPIIFGSFHDMNYIIWALSYCCGYSAVLLILASVLFSNREFN